MIPVFSNSLGAEEEAAVGEVFRSRWLTVGPLCERFEREFGAYRGVDPVLLFNSCTSATFASLVAVGVSDGDEVIVPSIQFQGVANAVVVAGARPVFADVDPRTLSILPSEIERLRTPRTKAVYLLHYGGHPAAMADVLAASEGLLVLEDAANAVASSWQGRACGTLGDGGVWSFDPMKILVTGDGGALWLKDAEHRRAAAVYRYLGMPPGRVTGARTASDGGERWWEVEVERPSGRHISNDVSAAVGLVQLGKVDAFVRRRREVWATYQELFADVGGLRTPPEPAAGCTSSHYLYWIDTDRRDELARHLYEHGVYSTFRYHPLHLVPVYGSAESLPAAEAASERTLCLPLHQNLEDADVDRVADLVRSFVRRAPVGAGGSA